MSLHSEKKKNTGVKKKEGVIRKYEVIAYAQEIDGINSAQAR